MRALTLVFLTVAFSLVESLAVNYPGLDKSPADIALFKKGREPLIKVVYGRPQKKGREVFGKLVKYGKVWRTGANENTEIRFYKKVRINGKEVPTGIYSLFTIPNEKEWTLILNSDTDKWGAYSYKEANDVLRAPMSVAATKKEVEAFSIAFDKNANGATLSMAWDNVEAQILIETVEE